MDNFDRILDDCLVQLSSGASTLDECLARHPKHAAQLRPLLLTASRLERGRLVRPSPAFKARARARLTLHMQAHPRRKSVFMTFLRAAFSMAVLALTFLAAGTALAQGALPGDALYRWKLTSEQAWRAASSDTLEVDLALLGCRADELVAVAGDPARVAEGLVNYQETLTRLTVQTDAEAQARILAVLQSQQELLVQAGIVVPELDIYLEAVEQTVPPPTPLPVPTMIPSAIPTVIPTIGVPTASVPTLPVPTLPIPPLP